MSKSAKFCSQSCRTSEYRKRKKQAKEPTSAHRNALMYIYNNHDDIYFNAHGLVEELGLVSWCKVVRRMLVLMQRETNTFDAFFKPEGALL